MEATCVWAWTEEVADGEYEHRVALCDDDGEPIGAIPVITCQSADAAMRRADRLGDRYGLEVITDDLKRG